MSSANSLPAAAIFDMDGVLVNSNPFHLQNWINLLNKYHIPYDREGLEKRLLGPRTETILRSIFGLKFNEEELQRLSEEVEEQFRRVFRPHVKPLPGLTALITECHQAGIPMAVASSGLSKNVEFIVEALGFQPYFRCLIPGDDIERPKPHPEIYLKAAEVLGLDPAGCVAIEDSFVGVEAAKRAGMKCLAIASTFSARSVCV